MHFILWRTSSDDKLSSNTSSLSCVESLQLAGERYGFNFIVQPYQVEPIADMEEQDVEEEDEDNEDCIDFASLESWLENKETVRNWKTINLSCLQYKKMAKVPLFGKIFNLRFNNFGCGCLQIFNTCGKHQASTKGMF